MNAGFWESVTGVAIGGFILLLLVRLFDEPIAAWFRRWWDKPVGSS